MSMVSYDMIINKAIHVTKPNGVLHLCSCCILFGRVYELFTCKTQIGALWTIFREVKRPTVSDLFNDSNWCIKINIVAYLITCN